MAINIKGLCKSFGNKEVLRGLDLVVPNEKVLLC